VIFSILPRRRWISAQARNICPHGHEVSGVAVRARLSCWTFGSGSSVIHVQGASVRLDKGSSLAGTQPRKSVKRPELIWAEYHL
jgi:hypothetical protein